MLKLLRITSSALALAFLSTSASLAAQELVIKTDQTQLISVSGNPGTVVIGNPSIADATVHGNKLFVHGRAFGTTNLIILDENGNQLSNLDITVMLGGENNMQVYKAGARYSLYALLIVKEPCNRATRLAFSPIFQKWTQRNPERHRARQAPNRKQPPPPSSVNIVNLIQGLATAGPFPFRT